jgi:DNA-binding LytR/AlgR family response regulator
MNPTIKCVIIEDEPLAQEVLKSHISNHPQLEVIQAFNNGVEAKEWLQNNQNSLDVVFTDIEMPGLNGLDLIRGQYPAPYAIVFTTAHPNFATDAFEIEALDYLLKPIAPDRFAKAVKRIEEYVSLKKNVDKESSLSSDFIFVKVDGQHQKVYYNDIYFVEAFADYVKIWLSAEKRIVTLQTMRNMENALPKSNFLRIHRSFIVALDKIESVQNANLSLAGKLLPIGKNYKDAVLELINKSRL